MKNKQGEINWKFNHPLLAGVIKAFIWMTLGMFILSILIYANCVSEQEVKLYSYIIHCIALFIGGWTSGKRGGKKGGYYGGMIGVSYMSIILLIAFLALNASIDFYKIIFLFIALAISAFGGIIGTHLHKASR